MPVAYRGNGIRAVLSFLIRRLLEKSYAKNIIRAKRYIARQDPIIWRALMDILGQLPILLNRAPTLHRLGIQAFRPYLVAGQAISLHPWCAVRLTRILMVTKWPCMCPSRFMHGQKHGAYYGHEIIF